MLHFYTPSVAHLISRLDLELGDFTLKRFNDGEIYVKIFSPVANQKVRLVTATPVPSDNLLEALFLLDALTNAGASVEIVFTYFGYARQDKPLAGESHAGESVCRWLAAYRPTKVDIVHMHSQRLKKHLAYRSHVPYDLIERLARDSDVVVSPDSGAIPVIRAIGDKFGIATATLKKTRPAHDQAVITSFEGCDIKGKKALLVDDMITTGNTLIEACLFLEKKGAKRVRCFVTHGVFSYDAAARIEASPISALYVTNSLAHKIPPSRKIKVIDLNPFLMTLLSPATGAKAVPCELAEVES